MRAKHRKLVDAFHKIIKDVEENLSKDDVLNEQHLKLLKAEIEFNKLLKSNGSKIIKTKKK